MTEPRSSGSVGVEVVPDASDWVPRLREQIIPGTEALGDELGRNIGQAMLDQLSHAIDEFRIKLDTLAQREVDIRVNLNDYGSIAATEAKLGGVGAASAASGGGVDILSFKILAIGAAAVAATAVAIPAILAIGAAAGGALAGIGILGLGLSGVGEALQAANKPAVGGGGAAGRKVAGADLSQRSQEISAAQATQSAQDQLTQAEQNQAAAEKSLHDARVQAILDLEDLDNKLKDNALNQQQNAIDLATAKKTLAQELAAPGANLPQYAQQIAQARLDVERAQQKQIELREQGTHLAAQDEKAHKAGVDGAQAVLAAKQKLIDANHKLAEAQANVSITAEKNAIAAQQAALGMENAAAGANAFGAAMAKLNPLQQQFVDFLLTLKPLFEELKTAASLFLPGLEQGIKNALPAFGPFLQVIGNAAAAVGDVFAQIGKSLASADGQKFLKFLATELPQQIHFLGNLFIDFGKIFASIWEAAGPLIEAADKAILTFFDDMANTSAGQALKDFFDSLIPLMPQITTALEAIATLFGSIVSAISPLFGPLLDLITLLATELASLAEPVLKPLAIAFGDLIKAVEPLIPPLAQLISQIVPPLIQLLDIVITSGILPLAEAIAKALTPLIGPLSVLIAGLVAVLAPLVVQIVQQLAPILPIVAQGFLELFGLAAPLIPLFIDLVKAVEPLIPPMAQLVQDLVKLAVDAIPLITPFMKPFTEFLKDILPIVPLLVVTLTPFIQLLDSLANTLDRITGHGGGGGGLFGAITSTIGAVANPLGGILPGILGGGHAAGGPVEPGHIYPVNETGAPELFMPWTSGSIVDGVTSARFAKQLNNVTKNQTFNIYGSSDPLATAHAVAVRAQAMSV